MEASYWVYHINLSLTLWLCQPNVAAKNQISFQLGGYQTAICDHLNNEGTPSYKLVYNHPIVYSVKYCRLINQQTMVSDLFLIITI